MKTQKLLLLILMGALSILQSCARNGNDVWDDTKSAGRHVRRGVRALGGKHGDSRQIRSRNDFECIEDEGPCADSCFQDCNYQDSCVQASDFVPFQDQASDEIAMADMVAPQPRETPGEEGSSLPGINAFRDPATVPEWSAVFRNVYFEYNSSLIKGPENLRTIHTIADYLKRNPRIYIFIEGHTDERGPDAYNFALGARRANAVRNLLISEGVNPDHLFTISYGKDRPVVLERHEEGWAKNRRAEFKIYAR